MSVEKVFSCKKEAKEEISLLKVKIPSSRFFEWILRLRYATRRMTAWVVACARYQLGRSHSARSVA